MKRLLFCASLLGCLLLFNQCEKEDRPPLCSVSDPLVELPWLKAIIVDTTNYYGQLKIYRAIYQKRTVYEVTHELGPDGASATIYTCQGDEICRGGITIVGFVSDCKEVFDQTKKEDLLYSR